MLRVLVTGATGLVGRQLLPQLAEAGYDVHALHHQRPVPEELKHVATWHESDLSNAGSARAAIADSNPALLFHLAWPAITGSLNSDIHRGFLAASQELVHEFYRKGGTRVVVAGTCFEYDWSEGLCTEDRTPTNSSTVYGECKDRLRQFTKALAEPAGRSWAWGRIFFVYGPHQEPTRFVPALIHGLLEDRPVECTEGRQVRDYLHAADVASALLHLGESSFSGTCNIGSGEAHTLREIATLVSKHIGKDGLVRFGAKPTPLGEPPVILADVHRLRDTIGWKPRYSLADGLAETIASYKAGLHVPVTL